jgi:hypothetical protein
MNRKYLLLSLSVLLLFGVVALLIPPRLALSAAGEEPSPRASGSDYLPRLRSGAVDWAPTDDDENEEITRADDFEQEETDQRVRSEMAVTTKQFGWLAAGKESGKKGSLLISHNPQDPGATSYGTFQFNTTKHVADDFVKKYYANDFKDLKSGTSAFDQKWTEVATRESRKFRTNERDFVTKTYYKPVETQLSKTYGVNLNQRSPVVKEVLLSSAIQHGVGGTKEILKAIANADGNDGKLLHLPDKQLITAIYTERGRTNESGKPVYFQSSGPNVQSSVAHRFPDECKISLRELAREESAATKSIPITSAQPTTRSGGPFAQNLNPGPQRNAFATQPQGLTGGDAGRTLSDRYTVNSSSNTARPPMPPPPPPRSSQTTVNVPPTTKAQTPPPNPPVKGVKVNPTYVPESVERVEWIEWIEIIDD